MAENIIKITPRLILVFLVACLMKVSITNSSSNFSYSLSFKSISCVFKIILIDSRISKTCFFRIYISLIFSLAITSRCSNSSSLKSYSSRAKLAISSNISFLISSSTVSPSLKPSVLIPISSLNKSFIAYLFL